MTLLPKVSIIIPVYNGANYLREAIDSALNQTYGNIEVIVVNDGSADEGKTEAIAESYGSRIRYFWKKNGGVASALNAGIREMTGQYFSWLSHDDVYYSYKIEIQMKALPQELDVICYSDYDFIDAASAYISTKYINHVEPSEFRYALLTECPIHGCTALIPRACFEAVGLFDERLMTCQDYDLWFRMAGKYQFRHIQHVLIKSRIHGQQGTIAMNLVCNSESNRMYMHFLNQMFCDGIPHHKFSPVVNALIAKGSFEAASYALNLGFKKDDSLSLKQHVRTSIFSLKYRSQLLLTQIRRMIGSAKKLASDFFKNNGIFFHNRP